MSIGRRSRHRTLQPFAPRFPSHDAVSHLFVPISCPALRHSFRTTRRPPSQLTSLVLQHLASYRLFRDALPRSTLLASCPHLLFCSPFPPSGSHLLFHDTPPRSTHCPLPDPHVRALLRISPPRSFRPKSILIRSISSRSATHSQPTRACACSSPFVPFHIPTPFPRLLFATSPARNDILPRPYRIRGGIKRLQKFPRFSKEL